MYINLRFYYQAFKASNSKGTDHTLKMCMLISTIVVRNEKKLEVKLVSEQRNLVWEYTCTCNNPLWVSTKDREISSEATEFQSGTRLL